MLNILIRYLLLYIFYVCYVFDIFDIFIYYISLYYNIVYNRSGMLVDRVVYELINIRQIK